MATSEEIFAQLEILVHAFPGKEKSKETFAIYIEYLADIHPELLRRAVNNLIENSTWFPRVAEIRAEAVRIVGFHNVSTWEPPVDVQRAQYYHLEQQFFHERILDPDSWLSLAEQFANRDRPHSAEGARRRLAIFQQIMEEESKVGVGKAYLPHKNYP